MPLHLLLHLALILAGAECEPVDRVPAVSLYVSGAGPDMGARRAPHPLPITFEAGKPLRFEVRHEVLVVPPQSLDDERYEPRSCDVATWDFGDGTPPVETSAREKVEHVFAPGMWRVQLHVTNEIGRSEPVGVTVHASAKGEPSGGTRVPLRGKGFSGDCEVFFGDREASAVESLGEDLVAVAPPHAAGVVDIHVDCDGTRVTLPQGFVYVKAK